MARQRTGLDATERYRTDSKNILRGGRERTFTVVTSAQAPRPPAVLVLVLHGSNQTGTKLRASSGGTFDRLIGDQDAVMVYPDAYKGLWNDARSTMKSPARADGVDDVDYLITLLEDLLAEYGPLPVYVVSYSNGGQMAIRLVHEHPERFSGAVLIGTTQPTPDVFALDHDRHLPLPIVLIHGTRDPFVPYNGGMASLFGFRPRGTGMSALDTAEYFAGRNQIQTEPTVEQLEHQAGSRKTSVTVRRWRQAEHPSVTLFTVIGGGHTIPNPTRRALRLLGRTTQDIDAGTVVGQLMSGQGHGSHPSA